jgi:hypothetical protein
LRNGRYAKRSIPTPSAPQPIIATANMIATATQPDTTGFSGPPSHWRMKKPMNAPTM